MPLWIINGLAVTARPAVIRELASRPEVASVELDAAVPGPAPPSSATVAAVAEQNLDVVNAPDLWALGYAGSGVVVANMDTGVDGTHPDLASRWRGGTNSWYDPYGQHPTTPTDPSGHGTMTMGIMVGGDAGGTAVGMAPDARWIAAKIFNDQGSATLSGIHLAFQWLVDPDGDPATDDAPDVVNGSWTFSSPGCFLTFHPDVQALRAAGILPVFAAGNSGPGAGTSHSPANYPESFAVGATDNGDLVAGDSSRGPDACGGAAVTFPDVAAPGVNVRSTDTSGLYAVGSGTSFSAPHAAGALALLLDAFPSLTPDEQDAALRAGAVDLGTPGPDNTFGSGRLDVLAAYESLNVAPTGSIGDTVFEDPDSSGTQEAGEPGLAAVTVTLSGPGADGELGTPDDVTVGQRVTDAAGAYRFDGLPPGPYRLDVEQSTLPAGAILTTGNLPLDLALADGEVVSTADFGYVRPPPPPTALQLSLADDGSVAGLAFRDEDTLAYDGSSFALHVDGSDVGLGAPGVDVDAVERLPDGGILLSFASALTLGSLGSVDDSDVVRFDAVSLGDVTAGTFSWYLDGSDVGLTTSSENVDALDVLPDGRVLISTNGGVAVPGVSGTDEDLLVLTPTQLGPTTSGTWAMYFDGSDVALTGTGEDVDALDVGADGRLHLSTSGDHSVGSPGIGGGDEDVLVCVPTALGPTTACTWEQTHSFSGVAAGLAASNDVDALAPS